MSGTFIGRPTARPASMLLTLLRHGDVEGRAQVLRGRSDPVLSAYGQQQLQLAIASIEPAITAVVTSPLQRCHAFAQQYAQQHNLPLQRSEELREIDFGDWEELTLAEAEAHDPAYFTQFKQDTANWCAPHGEAYAAFRERVRTALTIIASMKTRHILAITHGGVMRALIAELLQLSPASAARIGVPLAGICQLWLDEQVPDEPIQGSLLRLHWLDAPCAT